MAERELPPPCRTMGDYFTPFVARSTASIARPPVAANNFKPCLLELVQRDQFGGGDTEDPNLHIHNFLWLCGTLKVNGVADDTIRLRSFPFSLRDKAKSWLQSLPQGSITTWKDLATKFLSRFLPLPQQQQMQQGSSSNLENALLELAQASQSFTRSFKNREASIHSPDLSFSISHSQPAKSATMSIYTSEVRCYCQSRSNSHDEHDVAFSNDVILTCTVTNSQFGVDQWISETKSIHPFRFHPLLVGLDTEWRPFGRNNPVATLQLCVGHRCLIFQLLYALNVPQSLRDFLRDSNNTFVGVGVDNDAQKLMNDFGLQVSNTVDLARLARTRLPLMNVSNPGLKFLAYQVLGVDIEKPKNITLSCWDDRYLSLKQVQYASVDAYASFEIGRVWRAWEESHWFRTFNMDD